MAMPPCCGISSVALIAPAAQATSTTRGGRRCRDGPTPSTASWPPSRPPRPEPSAASAASAVRRSLRSLLYTVESKRLLYRRAGTPTAVELEMADGTLPTRAQDADAALAELEQQATGAADRRS